MRLGVRPTLFQPGTETTSVVRKLYNNASSVNERHRHRYEVNPEYVERLEAQGLKFVGRDDKGERMEILELDGKPYTRIIVKYDPWYSTDVVCYEGHPYFVGCQYHPEYLTRPLKPSPPFLGLILAASGLMDEYFFGNMFSKSHLGRYDSNTDVKSMVAEEGH